MTKDLKTEDLGHFTNGTENWYRHGINRNITYTDGAKYVADHGEAHWLIDEIAIRQSIPAVKAEEFQVWTLTVPQAINPDHRNRGAVLECGDGNGTVVHRLAIEFTDFPLPEITLWCENGVIYLPSEH